MTTAVPTIPLGKVARVNLIPKSELDRRERVATMRRWAWGVVGAVLVSLALIAGALAINWMAERTLSAEEARTDALFAELASLSDVSDALAIEEDLLTFRSDSSAADFAWGPVLSDLEGTLPDGVEIAGFDLTTGGVPQTDDPSTEVGLEGSLTLRSTNAIDIAETVRAMRALESVAEADGSLVAVSQQSVGAYTYEIGVVFDQSIYSGQFTPEGDE